MRKVLFEIDDKNKITLIHREVDCNSISCEEFVKNIKEDLLDAENQFIENAVPEIRKFYLYKFEDDYKINLERTKRNATKYAEKKWKTDARRQKYIDEKIKIVDENFENLVSRFETKKYSLSYFNFDPKCGTDLSIDCRCILKINASDEEIESCFNVLKSSKYFQSATGWKLLYSRSGFDGFGVSGRPSIELILPEEMEKKRIDSIHSLNEAVYNFYNGNFTGD